MTSAYGHPIPDAPKPSALALLAERFGEDLVPLQHDGGPARPRPAIAAALHAIASYIAAAAPLPAPSMVQLYAYVPDVAALESVAHSLGQAVYGQQRRQVTVPIEVDGIHVAYTVAVVAKGQPL